MSHSTSALNPTLGQHHVVRHTLAYFLVRQRVGSYGLASCQVSVQQGNFRIGNHLGVCDLA